MPVHNKGKVGKFGWYNDGTDEQFCVIDNESEGWTRGRKPGRTWNTPRKTARLLGFQKYNGYKCPEGHTLRYVSTGQCVHCLLG